MPSSLGSFFISYTDACISSAVKEYDATLRSIANGTDSSAPENPLSLALSDLNVQLQDIVIQFELQLADINSQGLGLLTAATTEADGLETPEETKSGEEPVFSVLPVSDAGKAEPTPHSASAVGDTSAGDGDHSSPTSESGNTVAAEGNAQAATLPHDEL